MADPIYKVVEVVGTSEQSISKAIDSAINKASGTLRNLGWFEVAEMRGKIKDGKVQRYQITLKVGFAGVVRRSTSHWAGPGGTATTRRHSLPAQRPSGAPIAAA